MTLSHLLHERGTIYGWDDEDFTKVPLPNTDSNRRSVDYCVKEWTEKMISDLVAGVNRFGLSRWPQIRNLYSFQMTSESLENDFHELVADKKIVNNGKNYKAKMTTQQKSKGRKTIR